mmetsp:Transcript_24851/g.58991  ORF Transcript_24851/g.58991 Transcript_24851/m.58991 type:complete len:334 (+) Transcript_24851:175-1176(+)
MTVGGPAPKKVAAEAASKGLSFGGKAFFGTLCAGTFGLGVWQIERFFEKIQQMEERGVQLALEPTTSLSSSNDASMNAGEKLYRRRRLQGVWRHDREVLVGPRGAPPGVQMPLQGLSAKQAAKSGGSGSTTSSGMAPGPQGFHVLTPLQLSPGTADRELVWVNRGWVPKKLVPGADRPSRVSNIRNRDGSPVTVAQEGSEWASYPAWNREEGPVTVTTIQSKIEKPRFMTPQHDYSKRPLQLFWLDGVALQALSESNEETMLMTQVKDDTNEGDEERKSPSSSSSIYPLQPPVEAIATFKTTPSIHAGYAATWFGLSAAGIYMTRKLISKGRF